MHILFPAEGLLSAIGLFRIDIYMNEELMSAHEGVNGNNDFQVNGRIEFLQIRYVVEF